MNTNTKIHFTPEEQSHAHEVLRQLTKARFFLADNAETEGNFSLWPHILEGQRSFYAGHTRIVQEAEGKLRRLETDLGYSAPAESVFSVKVHDAGFLVQNILPLSFFLRAMEDSEKIRTDIMAIYQGSLSPNDQTKIYQASREILKKIITQFDTLRQDPNFDRRSVVFLKAQGQYSGTASELPDFLKFYPELLAYCYHKMMIANQTDLSCTLFNKETEGHPVVYNWTGELDYHISPGTPGCCVYIAAVA